MEERLQQGQQRLGGIESKEGHETADKYTDGAHSQIDQLLDRVRHRRHALLCGALVQ